MHTILPIRHHSPGIAHALLKRLAELQPDAILVEGPPDADTLIQHISLASMQPPVAILLYVPKKPEQTSIYPFSVYAPEWQALRYGLEHNIHCAFMDLSIGQREPQQMNNTDSEPLYEAFHNLWDEVFEQRRDSTNTFNSLLTIASELRAEQTVDPFTLQREAAMRKIINQTIKDGYTNIAVICGAFHAPALQTLKDKEDANRLRNLPKTKLLSTWGPWTYTLLSRSSNYGAGPDSPAWYHTLWEHPQDTGAYWLTHITHSLRSSQQRAIAPAQIIDALQLAHNLASLRGHAQPGYEDYWQASIATFCDGQPELMKNVENDLNQLHIGQVPDNIGYTPLYADLQLQLHENKLPKLGEEKSLALDLRKDSNRARSILLHRLRLLGIPYARHIRNEQQTNTFREEWQVYHDPQITLTIIDRSQWGNTVIEASLDYLLNGTTQNNLTLAVQALHDALLADLQAALETLLANLQNQTALAYDVILMLDSLPDLIRIVRYNDVRRTDQSLLQPIIESLLQRLCIALPNAVRNLDQSSALVMLNALHNTHTALHLLNDPLKQTRWLNTLQQLLDQSTCHALLQGKCAHLLLNSQQLDSPATAAYLALNLDEQTPERTANWLEGFLENSGVILIHDDGLWQTINQWLSELTDNAFEGLLPLVRRTMNSFPRHERRQILEHAQGHQPPPNTPNYPITAARPALLELLKLFINA